MHIYKVLIWGSGKVFYQNVNLLRHFELLGEIKIMGVTSDTTVFTKIMGITYIKKEDIQSQNYDVVIVMSDRYQQNILNQAKIMGFKESQVISYKALRILNFRMDKYLELKKDTPSIFVLNCWGGITYHQLGLQFCSPFINMFEKESDYLNFLQNPKGYLELPLEKVGDGFNSELNIEYPICRLGDITLYFNHYASFDQARLCWNTRKERIHWDNLLVVFYTDDEDNMEEFDSLKYSKKVCFTRKNSTLQSVHTLKFANTNELIDKPLYSIVSGMAWGIYPYYDPITLLSTGKILLLSDM